VSWLATDGHRSVQTDTPTRVVGELASRFGGEIPELTVTRPSLEDIYLSMIGHAQGGGAAEGLPGRSPATTGANQ
jgi:ABC-2 type transport system ATP-binding protein